MFSNLGLLVFNNISRYRSFWGLLFVALLVSGCAKPYLVKLPPVTEGWHKTGSIRSSYVVQPKDTLYSIAWGFGLDYRHLAAINDLHAPYILRIGQRIRIKPSNKEQIALAKKFPQHKFAQRFKNKWFWPTHGRVVEKFDGKLGKSRGINIAGVVGQPIFACESGVVVYSGTGIRSYGKLLILKHNDEHLSAYAYNQNILVTEGKMVNKGQKIATMGYNNSEVAMLHFEIRCFGKPLDPLFYLANKHG